MPGYSGVSPGLEVPDLFSAELLFAGVAVFAAIGALSHEEERPFSATIAYVIFGVVAALFIQLFDIAWVNPFTEASVIEHVTEIALIIALFAAGLRVTRPFTWRGWRGVALLIGVTMVLTAGAVALYGAVAMGLSWGVAVALGGILAPTDPVLASAVGLRPPGEPQAAGDARFNLQGEAGVNDGMAGPLVLLGVFIIERDGAGWLDSWLLADVLYSSLLPIVLGGLVGWGMAWLANAMRQRDILSPELDPFLVVGAILVVYGLVDMFDTYGFLAAFAAGIGFRRFEVGHEYNRRVHDAAQVGQNFFELAVILLLASLVTFSALDEPGVAGWLLIPLLIVVIRPLLVFGSLVGTGMPAREKAFIGIFGVKGVASVHYVALLLAANHLPSPEDVKVFWTVAFMVIVSIFVHGVAASPLTARLLER